MNDFKDYSEFKNTGKGYLQGNDVNYSNLNSKKANEVKSGKVYISSFRHINDPEGKEPSYTGPINIDNIIKSIRKIYELNGITNLDFKYYHYFDFLNLKLNPEDATLVIFGGWVGMDGNLTELIKSDGKSWHATKHSEFENDSRINYISTQPKKKKESNWDVIIGIMGAHEIWHQYMMKSTLMLFGEIDVQKKHDNTTINLYNNGAKMYPIIDNQIITLNSIPELIKKGNLAHIENWQSLMYNAYFRGLKAGINPNGESWDSDETWKDFFSNYGSIASLWKLKRILKEKINAMIGN